jgi:hypothetical protein
LQRKGNRRSFQHRSFSRHDAALSQTTELVQVSKTQDS